MIIVKALKHLKLVIIHKWYVFKFCCIAGIPLQGILHDLSKFSPTEFLESAKYFNGEHTPITNCKEVNGYSMAWYHHRGRNKHHWEFWVDNFEEGMTAPIIPYKYAVEMLCDWLGAGNAYQKKQWSYASEYKWWTEKRDVVKMHPVIKHFLDLTLALMSIHNTCIFLSKKNTKDFYNAMLTLYNEGTLEQMSPYYPK
jgi:hypothetical protein